MYLKGAHPPFTSDIFYGFVKKLSSWIRSEDLMYNMMNVVDSDILYNWNLLGEYNLKILSQTSKKKKKHNNNSQLCKVIGISERIFSQCICLANNHIYILNIL